jgi:hypothetical protein
MPIRLLRRLSQEGIRRINRRRRDELSIGVFAEQEEAGVEQRG